MNNLLDHIQLDDLPEDWRQIAELIGLPDTLAVILLREGEPIHVPMLKSITTAARDRAIRAEFNGRNYRSLARKYNLTVRWVRQLLAGERVGERRPHKEPVDKQLPLF